MHKYSVKLCRRLGGVIRISLQSMQPTECRLKTYVKAKAIRAHVTTMASRMFHKSRQYERGWNITPKSITCIINPIIIQRSRDFVAKYNSNSSSSSSSSKNDNKKSLYGHYPAQPKWTGARFSSQQSRLLTFLLKLWKHKIEDTTYLSNIFLKNYLANNHQI